MNYFYILTVNKVINMKNRARSCGPSPWAHIWWIARTLPVFFYFMASFKVRIDAGVTFTSEGKRRVNMREEVGNRDTPTFKN